MIHKKFDLQELLIDYSFKIIHVYEQLPDIKADKHITFQLFKSGSSAAANYAKSQNTEFRADFIYSFRQLI